MRVAQTSDHLKVHVIARSFVALLVFDLRRILNWQKTIPIKGEKYHEPAYCDIQS